MKTKLTHIVIHFLIFICASIVTRPLLATEPLSVNYTIKDGLPSNEIYKIIQDRKGNLWIATDDGIVCFDGKTFNIYNENNGLRNAVIFEIYEDFKGRIWFTNYKQEVGYIDNGKISFIKAKIKEQYINPSYLKTIHVQKNGTLWITSNGKGSVFKLKPPYHNYKTIKKFETGFLTIDNRPLLYEYPYFYVKHQLENHQLISFNELVNNKITPQFHYKNKDFKSKFYTTSHSPKKDEIYYAFNETILYFKNKKINQLRNLNSNIISLNSFDDKLYVGVRGKGLLIFDIKNSFKLIDHFFEDYTVTGIVKTKQSGFWVSTLEKGIFYVPSFKFSLIKNDNLNLNKIISIQSLNKDNFFFLNTKEQVYNYQNNKIEKMHFKGNEFLSLKNEKLYVGSIDCGYYDLNNKTTTIFKHPEKGSVKLFTIEYAEKNIYFPIFKGILKMYPDIKPILNSKSKIISFKYDPKRKGFWCCNFEGIFFTDLNGKVIDYRKKFKQITTRVNEFVVDKNNNIWCATKGQGIFKISNDLKKITQIDTEKGLLGNNCKTIELDQYQNLWVGTTNGMNVILTKTGECAPVLLVNQFIKEEILDIHFNKNTLFIGTDDGLLKFDDLLNTYFEKDKLTLDYIKSDKKDKKGNYFLAFKCDYQDQNSFRKWILEYKIPIISNQWIQTTKSKVEISDIPYGKQTIEIRALSNAGYSKNTIKKTFYIPPKYYQTWWFFLLTLFSFGLFLYLFYKIIQSQTKKRERKKQEIQLMLSQMESKALRAQMNPHFIFNAMNSIQNFLLSDQEIEAVTFLGKFARLIRNILESTKSELITIKNEREILETYIELEQLRCSYSFDFEFKIEESISLETSQIPSMIIQPFIENAIIHGLIPLKERKGLLQISFKQDADNYFCTVEDNGVGRKQAQINNEKNRKFHTSMGMGITFDRIEQIQKMYGKTVSIEIVDKLEVENMSTGTKIFINFPKINLPL